MSDDLQDGAKIHREFRRVCFRTRREISWEDFVANTKFSVSTWRDAIFENLVIEVMAELLGKREEEDLKVLIPVPASLWQDLRRRLGFEYTTKFVEFTVRLRKTVYWPCGVDEEPTVSLSQALPTEEARI